MRTVRRRIRWSRVLLLLCLLAVLLGVVAGAAQFTYKTVFNNSIKDNAASVKKPDSGRINILLLGLDEGDANNPGSPSRSDTMIVASINTDDRSVNMLSIPRDTRVTIPGQKGYDKIAHACYYGGPQLAARTVEEFLHLPIHYYIAIDWQAFIKIVDIVGGVNLYVERDMNYEDPYANLQIHLQRGYQWLDGRKAGQYVRFRSDELGDIGRVQRQQRFIKALGNDALNAGLILKTPELWDTIKQYVATDIQAYTALKILYSLKGLNDGNLHAEMLPGRFATVGGLSYWNPDQEQIALLIERMVNPKAAAMSGIFDDTKRRN